jgi:hypothetical protein
VKRILFKWNDLSNAKIPAKTISGTIFAVSATMVNEEDPGYDFGGVDYGKMKVRVISDDVRSRVVFHTGQKLVLER